MGAGRQEERLCGIEAGVGSEDEGAEGLAACVEVVPDVAELGDGSEDGAPELVDIMRKGVGALDELGLGLVVDLQLHLAGEYVVELEVDQYVVGALPQPVLHPHYLHLLGLLGAQHVDFAVDSHDFLLPRSAFAPHQVPNFEGHQVRRRLPHFPGFVDVLFEEQLGHRKQPMDQAVQIEQDVAVQVFHHVSGEHAVGLFVAGDEGEVVLLEVLEQGECLLEVGVPVESLLELEYSLLFCGHLGVDAGLHPLEERVHELGILEQDGLCALRVVGISVKFLPELLAPLGEDAQDGWALYLKAAAADLLRTELRRVLRDLSADREARVALYPLGVLLLVFGLSPVCFGALLYPLLFVDLFEEAAHELLEVLVVGQGVRLGVVGGRTVAYLERAVDDLHDGVVVVAGLAVGEDEAVAVEEVVGEQVEVVGLVEFLLQRLVHVGAQGQRVLPLQVLQGLLAELLVELAQLALG